MKNILPLLLLFAVTSSCAQVTEAQSEQEEESGHWDPNHNFTVMRLIILNDNDEMLMGRENDVWAPPFLIFDTRQYLKEGLDSLATALGIKISTPQLHGYFSYKYEYHPYATMRSYFVAQYISGEVILPKGGHEVKWMSVEAAIDISTVPSIKESTKQIIDHPNKVWGGSFMVSRDGKAHPTVPTEPFYPLFGSDL